MKATRPTRGKRQSRPFERADLAAGEAREGGGLAEPAVDRAQRSIRPKTPLKSSTILWRAVLTMGEGKREEAAAGSGSVAVSGASPEAAAPAPPRKAGRPAAYTYNRIRGLFLLALIGLLGFGLSLLRDAPELTKSVIVGPNGETILVVIEKVQKGGGRGWPFDPEVHLILSR